MSDYISREAVEKLLRYCVALERRDKRPCKAEDILMDFYRLPAADVVEVVRCKECIHWKPPHVLQNDGMEREYNPETDTDSLGLLLVSVDVGINVGGKCYVDHNNGYADDKTVFRTEDNYCGKAIRGGNIPLNGGRKDGAE